MKDDPDKREGRGAKASIWDPAFLFRPSPPAKSTPFQVVPPAELPDRQLAAHRLPDRCSLIPLLLHIPRRFMHHYSPRREVCLDYLVPLKKGVKQVVTL